MADDCDCDLLKIVDNETYNNYGEWKLKSFYQLRSWGVWKYIDGPESTPPVVPPLRKPATISGIGDSGCMMTLEVPGNEDEHPQKVKDYELWMVGNDRALCKIVNAVPGAQFFLVMHTKFAKEAWESLRSYYEPQNAYRAERIIHDIKTYCCTRDMDVAQWLNDMQRLYASVCTMDSKGMFSDRNFVLAILDNMPMEDFTWRYFVQDLRARIEEYDSHQPSPTPVCSHEFLTAIRKKLWTRRDDPETPAYFFSARAEAEKKAQKRHRHAPDAATGSNPPYKRRRTSSDKFCTNPHCGIPQGHDFADCVVYGGGSQGKYGPRWKGQWNLHLPVEQRTRANNVPPRWHPAHAEITTAPEVLTYIVD